MGLRRPTGDAARRAGGGVLRRLGPRERVALLRLGGLALFVAGAFAALALTGSFSIDRVRSWGSGYGAAGPLVFIAISSLLTTTLFPGPVLAGASGLLFGTALGTPVSVCAATLGACLAFWLGRTVAREPVEQLGGPRLLAIRDWVGRRGFTGVLLLRVAPGLPYSLVNYGVGLTRMRVGVFAAATAVGTAPRTYAYVALGGQLGSFSSTQTVVALVVLVAFALLGIALAARDPELREAARRIGSARRRV